MGTAAAPGTPATNGKPVEKQPRDVFTQQSYGGTPRGRDGLASPDDYQRDMADFGRRMEIFEEMGKSDDAIGIALEARVQETNAANWQLTTADESDLGAQILEFCEDNVYPHIENLLRWLAKGPLQYGFALIEPVFAWSDEPFVSSIQRGEITRPTRITGERRIYLRRVAHIRQPAVTAFKISATGELEAVRQEIFDGERFRRIDIPAGKLLLRVYGREGDDYSGLPPLRHLYKGFKFKGQIERLVVLHLDKFGVGVPVYEEPPQGLTPAERALVLQAGTNWQSGTSNSLTSPNGGGWSIITGEGTLASSGLEWSKHFGGMTAKSLLTQQMELGSTETGSRAVGETFAEQLGGAAQADCEDIANLLNNALIVPLVKWNFGPQESYPTFSPSQRSKGGTADASTVQAFVTAGFLHARPEDEAEIRDRLELPAVDPETLKAEQDERDAKAAEIAKAATAVPGQPPKPADQKPPVKVAATREPEPVRMLAQITPAEGAPVPAAPYETSYRTREFAMWEQRILRPDLLTQRLDLESTRLAAEVQHAFGAIDADLERQIKVAAEQGPVALKRAVSTIAVPEKLKRQLRAALIDSAERVREFGGTSVRSEILRQIGPENVGPARNTEPVGFFRRALDRVKALAQGDADPSMFDLHIEAEVDRVVENEIDRREASARSSALTAIASWSSAAAAAGISLASIVLSLIRDALADVSAGRTEDAARGVVNVAFGVGRTEEAQAINTIAGAAIPAAEKAAPSSSSTAPGGSQEPAARGGAGGGNRSGLVDADGNAIELVAKVYSAVMDFGTCDECAKWDGAQFPIDYPEDVTGVQAPNPRCHGGISRCRCVWIYVTNLEDVPLVPAAKGPLAA